MKSLAQLILILTWVAGVVIAKGFWSTLIAVLVFPYAWYLVIEKFLIIQGWL